MLKLDRRGRLLVPERSVQLACRDLLRAHGWLVFETHTDARKSMGEAGQPDLVALKPVQAVHWLTFRPAFTACRVLLIECKRQDGGVSAEQRAYHDKVERMDFARPLVIRDVKELEGYV